MQWVQWILILVITVSLNLILLNLQKNVSLAVKRNFAKAGVTPSNYGGKIDGITNQISSDLDKTLNKLANYAYTLAADKDASNESIRAAYDKLKVYPL